MTETRQFNITRYQHKLLWKSLIYACDDFSHSLLNLFISMPYIIAFTRDTVRGKLKKTQFYCSFLKFLLVFKKNDLFEQQQFWYKIINSRAYCYFQRWSNHEFETPLYLQQFVESIGRMLLSNLQRQLGYHRPGPNHSNPLVYYYVFVKLHVTNVQRVFMEKFENISQYVLFRLLLK